MGEERAHIGNRHGRHQPPRSSEWIHQLREVVEFPLQVGVVQVHVPFAAAPEDVVLAAKVLGDFEALLDLGAGVGENVGVAARGSAVDEARVREEIGRPPEKLDAGISVGRNKALPLLKTLKGFRAMIASVDRVTGRSLVSTVWDTMSDLDASESKIAGVRAEFAKAAGISAESLKVEVFEAAVVELSPSLIAQTSRS